LASKRTDSDQGNLATSRIIACLSFIMPTLLKRPGSAALLQKLRIGRIELVEDVKESYTAFHARKNPRHVYPSEWVVRTMLGKYPGLVMDRSGYDGGRILDVGFGDGRNWSLFSHVGLDIHGVEITEDILQLGRERAETLGVPAMLKLGDNAHIPFPDDYFDYVHASASCYYVDKGTTFSDNLREYARVMRPGGALLATLPEPRSSIFDGCVELENGHVEIRNDPWGLRNGYIFRWFRDEEDIISTFAPYFESFSIGLCCDDFYGIRINLWLLVCRRKAT
jgi:SAM-dependent methyltransferase